MSLLKIDIPQAVKILKQGGLVFYPTETVYGIAVDALNESALQKIYQLKNRERDKPISILIPNISMLKNVTATPSEQEINLMQTYWPGALTILFKAKAGLPLALHQDTGSIAVRISSHPQAFLLSQAFGGVITTTSANPSGKTPATSIKMLEEYFGKGAENYHVIDGGDLPNSLPSTMVQVTGEEIKVLRQGSLVIPFN